MPRIFDTKANKNDNMIVQAIQPSDCEMQMGFKVLKVQGTIELSIKKYGSKATNYEIVPFKVNWGFLSYLILCT